MIGKLTIPEPEATTIQFDGFSRQELSRRANAFRAMSREADTIPERRRLETLARAYDEACDRAWRAANGN